jgi:hypothetical protein
MYATMSIERRDPRHQCSRLPSARRQATNRIDDDLFGRTSLPRATVIGIQRQYVASCYRLGFARVRGRFLTGTGRIVTRDPAPPASALHGTTAKRKVEQRCVTVTDQASTENGAMRRAHDAALTRMAPTHRSAWWHSWWHSRRERAASPVLRGKPPFSLTRLRRAT